MHAAVRSRPAGIARPSQQPWPPFQAHVRHRKAIAHSTLLPRWERPPHHPTHLAVRRASAGANGAAAVSDPEATRYIAIRSFFHRLTRQQLPTPNAARAPAARRSLHFGASLKDRQRPSIAEEEKRQPNDNSPTASSEQPPGEGRPENVSPFWNYPRTLRELALRAVGQSKQQHQQHHQHQSAAKSSGEALPPPSDIARSGPETSIAGQQGKESAGALPSPAPPPATSISAPRPSKEELLQLAGSFWTRLRIRFKWFTIRGFRRFNADDISAFFTLGGLGTLIFIIVGTTTAVSLVFAALNALNMQEWIGRRIADYLTSETGVTVIFESAIVPKWKDSRICFQNVFISRRAHGKEPDELRRERSLLRDQQAGAAARRRGTSTASSAQARTGRGTATTPGHGMAWEGTHFSEDLRDHDADEEGLAPPMSDRARGEELDEDERPNTNYSMFDLNVDEIDVTLSFSRWWDGRGLIEDAAVKGVRGIIDRRNVFWDPERPYDPRAARRTHRRGDFELESLHIDDFLVTVYQPGGFRPFNLSVFSARLPRLRKQWLFYDLLCADSITGQVDGCLFSLHKPQSIGRTTAKEREVKSGRWKTVSRLRVDGVNVDHIQNQSDLRGPISWILSGRFDVVADIKFPRDRSEDVDINAWIADILDNLSLSLSGDTYGGDSAKEDAPIPGQHRLSGPAIEAPVTAVGPAAREAWRRQELRRVEREEASSAAAAATAAAATTIGRTRYGSREDDGMRQATKSESQVGSGHQASQDHEAPPAIPGESRARDSDESLESLRSEMPQPSVVIDLDVRFKDVKAAVPLFRSDLTYRTQTFVRPIVAFMNANRTLIPVHCRVVIDLSEFDGSMDLAQTGLLPVVSDKIYEALANHVRSQQANERRLRSVSSWSLRLLAGGVLQLTLLIRDALASRAPAPSAADAGLTMTAAAAGPAAPTKGDASRAGAAAKAAKTAKAAKASGGTATPRPKKQNAKAAKVDGGAEGAGRGEAARGGKEDGG